MKSTEYVTAGARTKILGIPTPEDFDSYLNA
jgi:hypothetical protein